MKFKIGKNKIGNGEKVYFVADIAANHDGDIKRALKLIELAKESGADAAKFQHHNVSRYVSDFGFKNLKKKLSHQKNWKKNIFQVYKDAEVPKDWTLSLKKKCDEVGVISFQHHMIWVIDHLNPFVKAFKIGSGDVAWNEMLKDFKKPVFCYRRCYS